MVGSWPVLSILECASPEPYSTQIGPFGEKLRAESYTQAGMPILRGTNVNPDGRFHDDDFAFIDPHRAEAEFQSFMCEADDVVLCHKGTLGKIGIIPRNSRYPRYVMGNSMLRVRCDRAKLEPLYLYYWLCSKAGQDYLFSRVSQVGVPQIQRPLSTLREARLPVPPIEEQRAIVGILGALDDKIEVNRRMSDTLEAMALALFKSWFVERPELDWQTAPLAEWVDVFSGGTPSKSNSALWGGTIKWISPKAMTSIHADECDDYVTERAIGNGTRIAPKGSTLVMVRGMGLHDGVRVSQSREDVTFNQDVKALVPKNIEPDLLLYAMLDAREELHKRVETSGHGTGKMPSEILLAQPITMPSREVQRKRTIPITALNDRIAANRAQSRNLARLRDMLLPRLLASELSVAGVEGTVEEVA
jgi:type I restriction enzyme S subunit